VSLDTVKFIRRSRTSGALRGVGLSLLSDKTNAQGMREYPVAYGNARVTEGGAVELLQRLGKIYLGAEG